MSLLRLKADMPVYGEHVDSLIALHNRTVDALAGYTQMVEKAEPSFKPVAEAFRSLHATQADRLACMLTDLGKDDRDGTFMGTVHVAVVSLRATFDTIDEGVIQNIRDGETLVLGAFVAAIEASPDTATTAALIEMHSALSALLARTRHLE